MTGGHISSTSGTTAEFPGCCLHPCAVLRPVPPFSDPSLRSRTHPSILRPVCPSEPWVCCGQSVSLSPSAAFPCHWHLETRGLLQVHLQFMARSVLSPSMFGDFPTPNKASQAAAFCHVFPKGKRKEPWMGSSSSARQPAAAKFSAQLTLMNEEKITHESRGKRPLKDSSAAE